MKRRSAFGAMAFSVSIALASVTLVGCMGDKGVVVKIVNDCDNALQLTHNAVTVLKPHSTTKLTMIGTPEQVSISGLDGQPRGVLHLEQLSGSTPTQVVPQSMCDTKSSP